MLGKRWFDARSGLATAAILGFYPTLIAYSHYHWSETFYVFWFMLAALLMFDRRGGIASPRMLFVAGLMLGVATLARSVFVYLVPLLVPALHVGAGSLRVTARRAALFALGFFLAILPQTIHIYRKYDGLLLVSSGSARVWNECYNVYPPRCVDYGFPPGLETLGQTPRPAVQDDNQVVRVRKETELGLQFVAENPGLCFERFLTRLTHFVNPTSFLIRHIRRDYYITSPHGTFHDKLPPWAREAIIALTVATYLLLVTAAVLGLFTLPAGAGGAYLLIVLAFSVVLHALSFASTRYRIGIIPLLGIVAGFALVHARPNLRRLRSPWRGGGFALTMGALVYAWSLYWERIWWEKG